MSASSEIPHSASCTNVSQITVHRVSKWRRTLLLSLCVLAYGLVLPSVFSTMGQPLERAVEQARKLAENKTIVLDQAFVAEAQVESVVAWDDEDEGAKFADKIDTVMQNKTIDTINSTAAAAVGKNDTVVLSERPMPSAYLPDALPLFLLLLVCTATLLHFLMCRWFVWWLVMTQYEPEQRGMTEGCFVHVVPLPHRGKPSLCKVSKNAATGDLEFSFQRQTYVWVSPADRSLDNERLFIAGESSRDDAIEIEEPSSTTTSTDKVKLSSERCLELARDRGFVRVMLATTTEPVSKYVASKGIEDEASLNLLMSRFGLNTLSVPQPPFIELLKAQLLMPLSVFQLFSALLWAVDEYVQYTIFTLFTIVMMESTTAFQRHRTMNQLKGLSPKSFSVYAKRTGHWMLVPTEQLLPGDLISLRTAEQLAESNLSQTQATRQQQQQETIIPCDVLILGGTAIVNEATLTGESIPQMKDALMEKESDDSDRPLDVDGKDRIHTLFSGTSLVAFTPAAGSQATPDKGCLCLVLRTGFGSSQGELMQMIEFSSQAVSADSKETGAALLILLVFALISATYVFRKGMEKGDRTTHELLLKCIIIVTSVVPRQLPVQMALAVNHALMALLSEGIYCTEPFRVPEAGKVTHALFDKTGTLTADELTPIGVSSLDGKTLVQMREASPEATLVLATCHALVSVNSGSSSLAGDPIEVAAIRGVGWAFDALTSRSTPGDTSSLAASLERVRDRLRAATEGGSDKNRAVIQALSEEESALTKTMARVQQEAAKSKFASARIDRRFHFEAALQRMSVVATVAVGSSSTSTTYALCKGSPEAVKKLCASVPEWYDVAYRDMAERGMRVLALALQQIKGSSGSKAVDDLTRKEVESNLTFVGFVAFEAKIRGDSATVVQSLKNSAIGVAMVTGDAPLTALHVARCCGFLKDGSTPLMLDPKGDKWTAALSKSNFHNELMCDVQAWDCGFQALYDQGFDLVVTEEGLLNLAKKSQGRVWNGMESVCVFSRMSPRGKAKVIRSIQKLGKSEPKFVLMCGDGGNDVGALKQADVGLALLSGYGSANTAKTATGTLIDSASGVDASSASSALTSTTDKPAEEALNESISNQKKRAAHFGKLRNQELEVKKAELMKQQRQWIEEELVKLPEAERGVMSQFGVMKNVAARLRSELQAEAAILDRKYGLAAVTSEQGPGAPKDPFAALDEGSAGLPVVRPGDASVAAPFTSRVPSVRSVVHLIRQGRCTLLSSLQQQQIMMLECTISAYTYAAISLEGARSSERQMMVSGWLVMAASLSFSYSTPLDRMHPVRPLRSLFHPAVFLSIFGQALIHLYSMSVAVKMASETMGPEKIAQVVEFNKRVQAGLDVDQSDQDEDPLKMLTAIWHRPFMPNLMNTTVFLVETAQIMAVLFVNYKGRPFMKGLLENHALFLSLFICIGGVAFASWEVLPEFNRALHFYPFPDDAYRWAVMKQIFLVVGGTFIWDRVITAIFAPKVFRAMMEEAAKTTVWDLVPVFYSLFKTVAGFLLFATGNPVIWGAAWYANKKLTAWQEEQEAKRLGLIRPPAVA